MSRLTIFPEHDPTHPTNLTTELAEIRAHLSSVGVDFSRWPVVPLVDKTAASVLAAYAASIEALKQQLGYKSVDVVSLQPSHPDRVAFRQKFIEEHTHLEDETRFFASGGGGFYLHIDSRVYRIECTAGDLIRVPARTRHWFDMGESPDFTAIRFFTNPDGWVGHFTGAAISAAFPEYAGTHAAH